MVWVLKSFLINKRFFCYYLQSNVSCLCFPSYISLKKSFTKQYFSQIKLSANSLVLFISLYVCKRFFKFKQLIIFAQNNVIKNRKYIVCTESKINEWLPLNTSISLYIFLFTYLMHFLLKNMSKVVFDIIFFCSCNQSSKPVKQQNILW